MKKFSLLFFAILLLHDFVFSQIESPKFTYDNLEHQILTYQPKQKAGVSDEKFARGTFILKSSLEQVIQNDLKFNYSDYWNLSMVFIYLGEDEKTIAIPFQKAIDENPESICEYIEAFGEKSIQRLTKAIPNVFIPFYKNCGKTKAEKTPFDAKKYAEENGFDKALVLLIHQIGEDDQKYRKMKKVDWSKQTPLDKNNLRLIDSLFQKHKTYIGKNLVGKELESTMWAVIQHSNIEKMEAYLPVLHKAVQQGNLHATPLKMLLDRIHCIKYGYQFFGSQFGGELRIG